MMVLKFADSEKISVPLTVAIQQEKIAIHFTFNGIGMSF